MINEKVYKLIKNPNRKDFSSLLNDNQGEMDNLDFKREWIDFSKLATIMLGMANIGGGLIVFGLEEKENGGIDNIGLDKIKDKAEISSKLEKYIPESLQYDVEDFNFTDKKYYQEITGLFQIMTVKSNDSDLPYILSKQMNEVEKGSIYVRRGTKTVFANSTDITRMIDKRIHASVKESSLKLEDHLAQLRALYKALNYNVDFSYVPNNIIMKTIIGYGKQPKESYNDFILNIIAKKKNIIENYIGR